MASDQQVCSSGQFIGTGADSFTNLANAYDGSDSTYASGSTALEFSWKNAGLDTFGFAIPGGSTIDGFEVIVRGRDTYGGDTMEIWLSTDASAAGNESSTSYTHNFPAGASDATKGSPTDKWGFTGGSALSPSDVNDTNFGVVIDNLRAGFISGVRLYNVDIICYYTAGGTSTEDRIVHTLDVEVSDQGRLVHHIEQEASKESRLAHTLELAQAASDRIAHTIEGDKHTDGRLAHDLELVYAVSPNKFPPDTYESGDTSGTWVASSGSSFWDLVDELDEAADFLDTADYVYIADGDIVVGTSQLAFSCQSFANASIDQPSDRRLAIRGSCEKTAALGSVTIVAFVIYDSTTYVHDTPALTAQGATAHNDFEFIWETPPWGGSDWHAPQDIIFGIRITADTITSGDFRVNQVYLNYLGTTDGSLLKTFYPTEWLSSSGMSYDFTPGYQNEGWRDLRVDDAVDVYTVTPAAGDSVRSASIEGGGTRALLGPAAGYIATVKVDMRISGSTSVTVRGDFYPGTGITLTSDTQVITATSNTTFSFVITDLSAATALGDPDNWFFGFWVTAVDGSPEFYVNQMWLEVTGDYLAARLAHDITLEVTTESRMAQILDLPAAPEADWWDSNYLKRRLITYGTDHDALPADHTMEFEMQTGYEHRIASDAASDDALQALWYAVDTSGSPDRPYTYVAWQSIQTRGIFNVAIRRFDHYAGTWGTEIDLGATGAVPDGHFSPKVCVDGDGYVWVFYGSHGSEQFYRKSSVAWSIEGGWGAKTSLGASDAITYPRLAVDSAGNIWLQGRGYSGSPPIGSVTAEFAGYYKYTLSTTTWGSWQVFVDYGTDPNDREIPGELGSVYSGGFQIDDNDRLHMVISWWEGYLGTPNAGRAVSYIYSDDGVDWYQYNAANPSGEQVGSLTYPVRYVSHDGFSAITPLMYRTHMTNGPWQMDNVQALSVDINGYPYFAVPWVDPDVWNNTFGPADMYVCVWDGTDWTVTDLTAETSAPNNRGFGSCESIVVDNSSASVYVYAMVEPDPADEFASSEMYRWRGAGWGTAWTGQLLSANTALGLAATTSHNKQYPLRQREVITNRGPFVYWGEDVNYPFIKPTGDDVRIVRQYYDNIADTWSGTDLHRLPDRFRGLDTELSFSAGVPIPEDYTHPGAYTRLYAYYSFPNVAAAALDDPDNVWRYFEGFEAYTPGTDLDGQGGWTEYGVAVNSEVAHTYRTDLFTESKWDKITGGFQSYYLKVETAVGGPSGVTRSISLDSDEITIWIQAKSLAAGSNEAIAGIELHDSVSGDWIRLGRVWLSADLFRAGYWASDDANVTTTAVEWQANSSFPEWHKLTIQISSAGVSFWVDDDLVVSNQGQITSADSLKIMVNRQAELYYDHLIVKSFTANDSTVIVGDEEGDAVIPDPYPAIVHTADLAFFRSGRIAQTLELAQSDSDRLVHTIVGSKPAQDRIAEWLELDATAAGRLVHDLELTKSGKSRLFHWLEAEAADQARIVHSLVLAYNKSSRLAHDLELEAADLDQIAHMIVGDKHLSARLAHHIIGDKAARGRLVHDLEADASDQAALVHFAELDKHDTDRLVHMIVAEASFASQIAHDLELTKSGKARLAHILVGDKSMANRIAHTLEFEVSPEGRIAHILEMLAHRSTRIAHTLVGSKPALGRVAHTLTGDKPAQAQIVHWPEVEAADESRIAHYIELVVAASGRIAHRLEPIANRAARIVQILELEAADESRIAHTLELVQGGAAHIAHILVNDKHFSARLVHNIVFEAPGSERLMHTLELTKLMSSRLAHSLVGDKNVTTSIVHTIVAEAAKQARIMQEIIGEKQVDERIAQWLESDKSMATRLMHTIDFIGAVIGFKFTDSDWSTITMTNESMNQVQFSEESMGQVIFSDDSMIPAAVSWSGESMAQITFTYESMVPNC